MLSFGGELPAAAVSSQSTAMEYDYCVEMLESHAEIHHATPPNDVHTTLASIFLVMIPCLFNCTLFFVNVVIYKYIDRQVKREMQEGTTRCFALMDSVLVNLIPTDVLVCLSPSQCNDRLSTT